MKNLKYPKNCYGTLTGEIHYWKVYENIAKLFGNILLEVMKKDYSGDYYHFLYEKDGKYGYLQFGYGPCQCCDLILGCKNNEEIEKAIEILESEIIWFDNKQEMNQYFQQYDWEGNYGYSRIFNNIVLDFCNIENYVIEKKYIIIDN